MNNPERTRVLKALGEREHSASSIRESMLRHYSFEVVRAKLEALVASGDATRREQRHNQGVAVFYLATERRDSRKLEKAAFVARPRPKEVQASRALAAMLERSSRRLEILNGQVRFREMPPSRQTRALIRSFERRESTKLTAEANWR
ncbi:hypothetical protein [Singulisphaera sp. PoT]|uniref:hypothetical protein n=1 Tax=Singulisphaera sp. PoT TaxID=3411797 RepID=UPI003BF4C0A7